MRYLRGSESARAGRLCVAMCAVVSLVFVLGPGAQARAATTSDSSDAWQVQSLPAIGPGIPVEYVTLSSISCPAVDACVGVGEDTFSSASVEPVAVVLSHGSWIQSSIPIPNSLGGGDLSAIDCTSAEDCVAVGTAGALFWAASLSETTWTATILPTPPFITGDTALTSVSCPSAGSCTAVGEAGGAPIAESLHDGVWTAVSLPLSNGAASEFLTSISCVTIASCIVVGYTDDGAPIAVQLSGSTWQAIALPQPNPGTTGPPFPTFTVSCQSSLSCEAVSSLGVFSSSDGIWTLLPFPFPENASLDSVSDVSCWAVNSCDALATYAPPGGSLPILVNYMLGPNGWTPDTLPLPAGAITVSNIGAISCPSKITCVVLAGAFAPNQGLPTQFSEEESTGGWTVSSLPMPDPQPESFLSAVHCTSTQFCVAVGSSFTSSNVELPAAEIYSDGTWSAQVLPEPGSGVPPPGEGPSALQGLSCPKPSYCVAVGIGVTKGGFGPLAEVYADGTWTPEALPVPTRYSGLTNFLSGVSCVSVTNCVAVGAIDYGNGILIETFDGGRWKSRIFHIGTDDGLTSIVCSSANFCRAVGEYETAVGHSSIERPLVATLWNGSWSFEKLDTPYGTGTATTAIPMMSGIQCSSPSRCVAVGDVPIPVQSLRPIAETLSSGAWRGSGLPTLSSQADQSTLAGLACTSTTSCVAVGGADALPLVETLAGGVWSAVTPALPDSESVVSLSSISCITESVCLAVGQDFEAGATVPAIAYRGSGWP
jgi:hypothetical protein